MILIARHSAGFLDISSQETLDINGEPEVFRHAPLLPGQRVEIADRFRKLSNIDHAINHGLLELVNYDDDPGSEVVNEEMEEAISDAHGMDWGEITGDISNQTDLTPENIGAQPVDATLTALAALDSVVGLLRQTGADTFDKDTNTYPTTSEALLIDQTTPQTVIGGAPNFSFGINIATDNAKLLFGEDNDASIYYDGIDLIINPQEVGNGSVKIIGGVIKKITIVTDTYTILTSDSTIICNNEIPFTVTLPTAIVGQIFNIKNIGTGDVTIDGNGTDTIDGEQTHTIVQWGNLSLQCYAEKSWGIM